MSLTVHPVRTQADLRAFIELPLRLHPTDRYVPLWQDVITGWFRDTGPHLAHGHVQLLLARDAAGAVVGRTTVHSDSRMDAKLGAPTTLLGATEFSSSAALRALVARAEEVARDQGRNAILGPVSLLPNQTGGVITAGFEHRGFVDSPWNPEHYPPAWTAAGFEAIWPAATWICEGFEGLDPATTYPRGELGEDMTLHFGDRKRLGEQLPLLRTMLNASFAELPYFTPIEADELEAATDGLAHLLDETLLMYVLRGQEPVAFVLTVPDLSEFVMGTGGRLRILDQLRLLATKRRYRTDAVLIIKGTVPGARGAGLMSVLSRELLTNLQAGGYRRLRVTFIGEENAASAAQFAAMGGRPLHDLCFYRKALA